METENGSKHGGKATVEQIIASEERNKKEQDSENHRNTSREVNHLSKVIRDRKIITELTVCISSTRTLASNYDGR